jgi:hypothetical protein
MKVGLSNHQFVCFNYLVDFHERWYRGNAIQEVLDAKIFNLIASIILKLLRFKVVMWALLNSGFGFPYLVYLDIFHRPSLK